MTLPHQTSSPLTLLLLALLLVSPFYANPNVNAANDSLVATVCSKTPHPEICTSILKSDPRTGTANMNDLMQISIDLASFNATATRVKSHSLLLGTTDPGLKERLNTCATDYDDVGGYLDQAMEDFKSGDYDGVNIAGSAAYDLAGDCENSFKKEPAYQSPLTNDNYNMENLGYIVVSIAYILENGG
ncbi:hypothetical protein RJ640_014625 [Escallonia rubra]|uniref:Pectinesterase inhibitor domain-containing protein n=1 Tax=Escallonia rubra TaxID=112253 RepID=A0AA88RSL0_9ASTE|nr:hypothetical protein RJ640_014625 [Escallonia rubra]